MFVIAMQDKHGQHHCLIYVRHILRWVTGISWQCGKCGGLEHVDMSEYRGKKAALQAGIEVGIHQETMRQLDLEL